MKRTITDRKALDLISALLQDEPSDMLDRIRSLVGGTARIATPYTRTCCALDVDGVCPDHGTSQRALDRQLAAQRKGGAQ